MNKIVREMYAGNEIKPGTPPAHVRAALNFFADRLTAELEKSYVWLAHCTVAVEGGRWGGDRRAKRRLKLDRLLRECESFLGLANRPEFPKGWERNNLFYDYDACSRYATAHGGNSIDLGVTQHMLLIAGLNRADYRAAEDVVRRETTRFFAEIERWRTWCSTVENGADGVAFADRLLAQREEIAATLPVAAVAVARRLPESVNGDWPGLVGVFAPKFADKHLPDPGAPMCVLHSVLDALGGYPGIRSYAN